MPNVTTAVPDGESGPHAEDPEAGQDQAASGDPAGPEKPQDEQDAPEARKAQGRRKAK
jgi:hypothetical protein